MANPIAGTNAGSCVITGGSSATYQGFSSSAFCVDNTGTYAYVGGNGRFGSTIASSSGGVSLPQTSISVASTSQFPNSGAVVTTTTAGQQLVIYTGLSGGNTLTGCSGGTGSMTTGNSITNASGIFQIQLSNLTIKQAYWCPLNTGSVYAMAYDSVNSAIIAFVTSDAIWSIPFSGTPPIAGTPTVAASSITNIAHNQGFFLYDTVSGVVYNVCNSINMTTGLYGFFYNNGSQSNYTPCVHNCCVGGVGNQFLAQGGCAIYNGGARTAFAFSNAFGFNAIIRRDQGRGGILEVLADGSGATNSTNNGGTPGIAITNPYAIVYDTVGRLYVATQNLSGYYIDTDEKTIHSLGTLANNGNINNNQLVYLPSGGYSGVGNGQLVYMTSSNMYIAY